MSHMQPKYIYNWLWASFTFSMRKWTCESFLCRRWCTQLFQCVLFKPLLKLNFPCFFCKFGLQPTTFDLNISHVWVARSPTAVLSSGFSTRISCLLHWCVANSFKLAELIAALLYLEIIATQRHESVWWRKFVYGNKRTTASFCSRYCFTFSGPQDPASSQFPDAKVFQKKNSASTAAAKNYLCLLTSSLLIWWNTYF